MNNAKNRHAEKCGPGVCNTCCAARPDHEKNPVDDCQGLPEEYVEMIGNVLERADDDLCDRPNCPVCGGKFS